MSGLNLWYPRGQKEDLVIQVPVFYRVHFSKVLFGQGDSRGMVFYSDKEKMIKAVEKLVLQGTYLSSVYKYELEGLPYEKAMLQDSNYTLIFNEDRQTLFPEYT